MCEGAPLAAGRLSLYRKTANRQEQSYTTTRAHPCNNPHAAITALIQHPSKVKPRRTAGKFVPVIIFQSGGITMLDDHVRKEEKRRSPVKGGIIKENKITPLMHF